MSQQINLFNPAFQPQKTILSARQMGIALATLVLAIGVLAGMQHLETIELRQQAAAATTRLEQRQARLATVNNEFRPRQKDRTLDAQIVEAERQLAALRHISGVVARGELGDTSGFAGYFKALARQGVPGLWLTGISVAAGGAQIGIQGRALDPAAVPGYLNRLTAEPLMQGKSFASLRIGQAAPLEKPGPDGKPVSTPAPYVEFSLQSLPDNQEMRK